MTNKPYITIPEVARMMRESGQECLAPEKKAYRSLDGPAFPSAYQSGEGSSAFLIKTEEAEAWIAAGCPTPYMAARDGMIGTVRVVEMAEQAGLDTTCYEVRQAIKRGEFPSASKTRANGRRWEVKTEKAKAWIDAGCPTPSQLPDHLNAARIAVLKMRDRAEEIRAGIVDDGQDDGPDPWAD